MSKACSRKFKAVRCFAGSLQAVQMALSRDPADSQRLVCISTAYAPQTLNMSTVKLSEGQGSRVKVAGRRPAAEPAEAEAVHGPTRINGSVGKKRNDEAQEMARRRARPEGRVSWASLDA